MQKKKILFVAENFYPDITGGAMVTKALAGEMAAMGYDLLAYVPGAGEMSGEEERVDGIRIFRGRMPSDEKLPFYPAALLRRFLDNRRVISRQMKLWKTARRAAGRYYPSLEVLFQREKPDIVISVCWPICTHMICAMLRKKYKFQWDACYMDPFYNNRQYIGKKMRLLKPLEMRILSGADRVLMPSFILGDYQTARLRKKLFAAEHPCITETATAERVVPKSRLHFLYIGALTADIRNPDFMFRFFMAASHRQALQFQCVIRHAGFSDGYFQDISERAEGSIRIDGPVPIEEGDRLMERADILVSQGFLNANQMPSKILRHINLGKPIIHFSKTPQCPGKRLLSSYPLAFIVDETKPITDSVIDAFVDFCNGKARESLPKEQILKHFGAYTVHHAARQFL